MRNLNICFQQGMAFLHSYIVCCIVSCIVGCIVRYNEINYEA